MQDLFKYHKDLSYHIEGILVNRRCFRPLHVREASGFANDAIIMAYDSGKEDITLKDLLTFANKILKNEIEQFIPARVGSNGLITNFEENINADSSSGIEHNRKAKYNHDTRLSSLHCRKCKELKPVYEYYTFRKGFSDFTDTICKACYSEIQCARIKKYRLFKKDYKIKMSIYSYYRRKTGKGKKFKDITQEEVDLFRKNYEQRNESRLLDFNGVRVCKICNEKKPITEFNKSKRWHLRFCKECKHKKDQRINKVRCKIYSEKLSDSYIVRLLKQHKKDKDFEVTPQMIEQKRKHILRLRDIRYKIKILKYEAKQLVS